MKCTVLAALALIGVSALPAMALPNANALQPADGYATVSPIGGNPLNVTVTATKPGFGVFWLAITANGTLTPKSTSTKWSTSPDKDGAVWRTNTGAKGGMLIPAGQPGYGGFPQSGSFLAQAKGGATPTNVSYVLHVINLATGNTFWTTPGGGTPPPPPPPNCAGILLFGPDQYLTTAVRDYLLSRNPSLNVVVHQTTWTEYNPGEFTSAVNAFRADHKGAPPCAIMFDPEYVGPNGKYSGLDAADQQTLKDLILSGTGFVYSEPTAHLAPPNGQLASVLPVTETWDYDPAIRYAVIDPTNPITSGLTGLTPDPVLTGLNSWLPDSFGQADSLALLPVSGVTYANLTPILKSSPSGAVNSYALNYQPVSGPTATQPGGRVAVLGTDTYPGNSGYGTVSPTTLELYYNALRWTAGQ